MKTHRFDGLNGEEFEISLHLDVLGSITAVSPHGTSDNSALVQFTGKWRPNPDTAWFEITFDLKYVAEDGSTRMEIYADGAVIGTIDLDDASTAEALSPGTPLDEIEERLAEDGTPIDTGDIFSPFNDKLSEHVSRAIDGFDACPVPPEPILCLVKAGLASVLAQSVKCHQDINPEIALRKRATQFAACIGRSGVSIGIRTAFRTLRCIMALG